MAGAEVYNSTTVEARAVKTFLVPHKLLSVPRFVVKVAEVLLSFLAFVVEEVVKSCLNCGPLYFFEFISCTAFLFTLLLLILLATKLNGMVGITCWPQLDFYYTAAIALLFLLASVVFAAANGGTSLEYASVALGFLATVAFLLDLFLFWRVSGFPWRSKETAVAGSPTQAAAEVEALNA
ncbi:CKLF-like MARVEL transmembrane domain-containing protein 6 [Gadus macrocephalus]|uniref:CKLF-like MARVEL transmembrane domain-containing protein 6 n=1 Tax=Gadus macrocephalus TaxID=80720 RepID=UPI0028CB6963|nr:CKLF-like MARVEL transmembrane domain-containing protein 6 [Gadus macrocephalus]